MQSRKSNICDGGLNNLTSSLNNDEHKQVHNDSSSALQQFLDHIPLSSIPGIKDSLVLELKARDSVSDAIHMLYEKGIFGAAIVDDVLDSNTASMKFSYHYIGFIDFASMVLWCLEEYENINKNTGKDLENNGFFSILEQIPQIGQTKVGELAKSFLWEPFFPLHLDDTVLHALLLLSKHKLQVLPVMQQPNSRVIGFITQNAVVQFLLQSSGLEWFDGIADKNLSDFRFENNQEHPCYVSGDQTVTDVLKVLWKNQTCAVAVVDRQTKKIMGNVRKSNIYHLVKNEDLLRNRKILTVQEFIQRETDKVDPDPTIERDHGSFLTAGSPRQKNRFIPRMDSPVTNKENDTLKQMMRHVTETNSSFSFVINDNEQVTGLLTLRDIILQFATPCVNSGTGGGGFFEFALEQSGCHVKNGTMIRNH